MALFRGVHRMFRRRLCLLFVLVWIATVFLCGLEVMKYKTTLKSPGLSSLSKTSKHYQFMGRRQHQRHHVAKVSRFSSLSDGFRKDYSQLMKDKDEDDIPDKRIENDDEVSMEEEKANEQNSDVDERVGEYEEELDSAGRKNKAINLDLSDNKEDHEEDEEELEQQAQVEQEQRQRQEEFVEEETKNGDEQEEEKFEKEGEEEINKQGGEKQPKEREEQAEEKEEKLQQEQNYETNLTHVQDEKYKKENTAVTDEENDYFPQHRYEEQDKAEDHKGVDEQEEQEGQVEREKQEEQNQNDEQGQQDEQDEPDGLEERDDEEEENYRKLVNQSEGLKNEQRQDKQSEARTITQNDKESIKNDNNEEAPISKTQSSKMADDDQEENEGVSLNMEQKDELTVQDENEENKGKSSNKQTERFGAPLESVIKPGSVSNGSKARDKNSVVQDIVNNTVYLPPLEERVDDKGKGSPETVVGPSYEKQDKEGNTEVQKVKIKNVTQIPQEKFDIESSHRADKPTRKDSSVYARNEEENLRDREGQDVKVTKDVPSTHIGQLEGSKGTESAMAEKHLGATEITSTKKDGEGAGAAFQDKESSDVKNLREMANRTYGEEERRQNNSEMNTERKERREETAEKQPEMEERAELQTDHDRTEGDVKLKENGDTTEMSEMDEDKTSINREAGQESKATKSSKSAEQEPGETEKNLHSDGNGLQGNKAEKESVENERNKERRDEIHKNGTSVTDNKETTKLAEQANGDEQRDSTANENGEGARISERVEPEIEQSKESMKHEEDKLNTEEQKRINEGETTRHDSGNEYKHKVKNESESNDGTENENGSKEKKDKEEEQETVEEKDNTDKTKRKDVKRYESEDETKSDEAERQSAKSTSLTRTGQPTGSPKEEKNVGNSNFQHDRDHQQHDEKTGHEQDSFEGNKTKSSETNVRLAQRTTKPTMSEELLLRRQDKRRHTIDKFCQKQKVKSLPSRRSMENLVVIDRDEIIYCAIPKVASTEWREALSVELGHDRIQGKKAQNRTLWKHLNEYSTRNITEKLKKYYTFLFVREPFARLLSAYRSKFEAGNDYYLKTFGRKIIQDFRKNATEHAKNTGDDVTFLEFVKHIAVTPFYDEHWRPYDDICHMCSVNYDFVGHLETIEEDAPFLLKEMGIEDRVTFKSRRRSQTSSELLKYYSQIPAPYIKKLGQIYFKDFEMFGYPFPGPLKSFVVDST